MKSGENGSTGGIMKNHFIKHCYKTLENRHNESITLGQKFENQILCIWMFGGAHGIIE